MPDIKYWKWDTSAYPDTSEMSEILIPSYYDTKANNLSASGFLDEIANPYIIKNNKIISIKTGKILFDEKVFELHGINSIITEASDINTYSSNIDTTFAPYSYSFVRDLSGNEYYMFYKPILTRAYGTLLSIDITFSDYTDDLFILGKYDSATKPIDIIESGTPITFNGVQMYAFKVPGVFPCYITDISYLDSGTIFGYDRYTGIIYGSVNDDIQYKPGKSLVTTRYRLKVPANKKDMNLCNNISIGATIEKNKIYGIGL